MENDLGPIATTYDELQGLPSLREARSGLPQDSTDPRAVAGTLVQSVEILLVNSVELLNRATADVDKGAWADCALKLRWARDFYRVLSAIAAQILQHARLTDSPGFHSGVSPTIVALVDAISSLEESILRMAGEPGRILAREDPAAEFSVLDLHLACSHEMLMWAELLAASDGASDASWDESLRLDRVRDAVRNPHLAGDTYFMQFRACHQVPELLVWNANDHYLQALQSARISDVTIACQYFTSANELLDLAIRATYPVVANLTMNHYHRIRQNLGLTSGSHSQAIHVVLFGAVQTGVDDCLRLSKGSSATRRLLRHLCEQFRTRTQAWKNLHALLPKRNLGANKTRSLIGSPEAVEAVEWLRRRALAPTLEQNRLLTFLTDPGRLSATLLAQLGDITNVRFQDVQTRSGIFSPRKTYGSS